MLLWIVLVALTALAALAIARPYFGQNVAVEAVSASAIYRGQLEELAREREAGQVTETEAEGARREIARRLLAADAAEKKGAKGFAGEKATGIALVALTALATILLYVTLGRPDLPPEPLAERDMDAALRSAPLDEVAEYLFQRLAMNPNHPEGWVFLADAYMKLERYEEAAAAFRQAIELLGDKATADLYSRMGEALAFAAGARIVPEARAAFVRALELDPRDGRARYYMAIGKEQDGDAAGALAELEALLHDMPEDAPERVAIEARIARMNETPQARPKDDPAIVAMVESLAAKLEAEPRNLDGWLLLMTSYVHLEDIAKARAAALKAREIFADDPSAIAAIDAHARELGLVADDSSG